MSRFYEDTDEGPFRSYEDAEEFAQAEVGLPWIIVEMDGMWRVFVEWDDEWDDKEYCQHRHSYIDPENGRRYCSECGKNMDTI